MSSAYSGCGGNLESGPNPWQRISVRGHSLLQVCARVRDRSPETLSLGWLPAVRFIPAERVSGELPPTVDLRSPFFA